MSLKIYPIWDNTPIPITFSDLSQLLHQFGKSIQLILQQSNIKNKYYSPSMGLPEPSPIDTSEVMAHVSLVDTIRHSYYLIYVQPVSFLSLFLLVFIHIIYHKF